MQVKNISGHDISFMFQSTKSLGTLPVFETVNLIAGWTVVINEDIWTEISKQTKTVYGFSEETIKITDGKPTIRGAGGETSTPTRTDRQWDGTVKEVNLIAHLVKTRKLEIIESEQEPALPQRSVMEVFLKRFGEKVTDKMTDEEVADKVRAVKAELAALSDL